MNFETKKIAKALAPCGYADIGKHFYGFIKSGYYTRIRRAFWTSAEDRIVFPKAYRFYEKE